MEGAARLIKAYNVGRCTRWWTSCCSDCCVDKDSYRKKLFHDKWLKVEPAVEPSLIIWENLGFTRKARCCRTTVASIISLLLLFATTLLILFVKVKETELKKDRVSCALATDVITAEEALIDLELPEYL